MRIPVPRAIAKVMMNQTNTRRARRVEPMCCSSGGTSSGVSRSVALTEDMLADNSVEIDAT